MPPWPRTIGIGHQDFSQLIANNNFYIDKTLFIKEWWENNDAVTLITHPRRFGKTLNLSMMEYFFLSTMPETMIYSGSWPFGKQKNTVNYREAILSFP